MIKSTLTFGLIACFLAVASGQDYDISCKNANGKPLDWFFLYKLPRLNHENVLVKEGSAYASMDSLSQDWKFSDVSIIDSLSIPSLTLKPLYSNTTSEKLEELGIGYALFNDQADRVTVIKGHVKGVLLFNNKSAVYIVHSIPHFPPKITDERYYINNSQLVFGQSMMCLTVDFESLDAIGRQLLYSYPQVYDYFIPQSLASSSILKNLISMINGDHVQSEPWTSATILTTFYEKYRFISFSKFTDYMQDLYAGLVAPELKSNLNIETWNNGGGTLPSNCTSDFRVFNIQNLSFTQFNVSFSVHNDHSKWGVTTSADVMVVCVGDINRQIDQFKRAGGTVCLLDTPNVWKNYMNLVQRTETCDNIHW